MRRSETVRHALLTKAATEIGQSLFSVRRDALRGEGRAIVGAWPGTIREARSAVVSALGTMLVRHAVSPATHEEVGWVVHSAYDEARRAWTRSPERRDEVEIDVQEAQCPIRA